MIKRLLNLGLYFSLLASTLWLIGFVIFSLYALSFKYHPQNHYDAIVVLTGGTNRIKTGLKLIEEKKTDYMLISGVHKKVTREKLLSNAKPDILNKITLGYDALDTEGNAQEINTWIHGKNIHSILLVTSFYHMPRSIFEIKKANKDLKIIPWPVFPKRFDESVDWIKTRYAWLLLIEYHKMIFVQIKNLF